VHLQLIAHAALFEVEVQPLARCQFFDLVPGTSSARASESGTGVQLLSSLYMHRRESPSH